MKAGTAQKIILNTLSTGIMIGLGRTHDGLMTHMSVSNEKLHRRAVDIISRIAGTSPEFSQGKLHEAGNDLPVAILMATGCEQDEARRLLGEADDSVTMAMAASRQSSGKICDGA
jgi:N-acetylmuramic acid 6-phosphate etherase